MSIWHIARKDLQILFRDIWGLAYLFLAPIIIIAIASVALSGLYGGPTEKFKIPVVVEDSGQAAKDMVEALKKVEALDLILTYKKDGEEQPMTRSEAEELVKDKKAAIVIPKGFSKAVDEGKGASVEVIQNPADQVIPGVIKNVVSEYTSRLSTAIVANQVGAQSIQNFASVVGQKHNLKLDPTSEISKVQDYVKPYTEKPPIEVKTKSLEKSKGSTATPFDYNVPGYAVMFVLFGASSAASALLEERENGTLRKLKTLPISSQSILLGKMLSSFMTATFQCLVLFTVGYLVFDMNLGNSILGLLLMMISTAFAATGLAMLLAAFCKTRSQASGISLLVVLSMSALGGSWWPLSIVPEWLQKFAHVTLTAWSTGGFSDLLVYGGGLVDILLPAGVLLGMGLLFLTIAIQRFRFE
ncbi:ABC-2 type transport system permease protein [Thermoactinomyces sp. DSM 45891]|uniref:ABC transporter permease n=1 Tax=Thermoactinomyces sp. DSM 45891 TaxID=1761907 RepID=UPI00091F11BA|nr:ABC transporter permease [Thermoactinomyces sp. DSM 45891]SFW99760.1 ABC-2 type transport system permease protein [Thermoactinomyces sp. DSM 45891]